MMFDPPGSTLPPEVAQCERGCLQAILCGASSDCPYAAAATVINRCRSTCADAGQRAAFGPLEMQACPQAGTAALDALGLSGTCVGADNACAAAMIRSTTASSRKISTSTASGTPAPATREKLEALYGGLAEAVAAIPPGGLLLQNAGVS